MVHQYEQLVGRGGQLRMVHHLNNWWEEKVRVERKIHED